MNRRGTNPFILVMFTRGIKPGFPFSIPGSVSLHPFTHGRSSKVQFFCYVGPLGPSRAQFSPCRKAQNREPLSSHVGFPGDAALRRRLPWAGSDHWNTGGEDCRRRDLRGKDCHPQREIHAHAALSAAKIELDASVFAYWPWDCFVSDDNSYAGLIELILNQRGSMPYLGMSKGSAILCVNQNSETPWCGYCAMGQAGS